ncbi:MAG TPA: TIGR03619 family F420-dependent LLM class oxidoreductase [Acidimicrobiia bacterium]|nr:TIGR03619 family F420-dependent LLM class oxidoreductase [Acidimicrobiia bacterium]
MASIVPAGMLVYGMQLQVQAKSKTFVEEWEADAGAAELAVIVRKADETGFFYVAVCDHLAVTKPLDVHMNTTWYDTVATLGWIAGISERVRIMSHVYVLSYRHPLHTAKSFMTLDELSGGRAILGVGAGHLEGEFDLLGLDFAERGRITDAAIDVVREAFAHEYPEIDTPYWGRIADGGMAPRPRQTPLPIWVGGSSKPALRRAAERGDGWLPQGTPRDEMPDQIAFLLEHRKATRGDEPIDLGTITEYLYVGDPGWDVGDQTLSGDPAMLAERLNEFGAMGVSHLQVRFRNRSLAELLDQMDAFARDVAPHLQR